MPISQEQYEENKKLIAVIKQQQSEYGKLSMRYDTALSGLGEVSKHTNEEPIRDIIRQTIDKIKSI